MAKLKQYGIVIFGLMLGLGFGGSMFAQNYTGSSSSPQNNDQQTRNYTQPSQNYVVGSFNKSMNEQVVIAARNDKAFVSLFYETEEQRQELSNLSNIQNSFGDRVFIQLVNSTSGSDIITQNGIVDFPKVVVIGGQATQRGLVPKQVVVPGTEYSNITRTNLERAVCNTLINLGSQAARCQQIGAF